MSTLQKSITDSKTGLTYTLVGDYYLPDLELPQEERPIGRWGRLHREYLEKVNPILLNDLILTGELWGLILQI